MNLYGQSADYTKINKIAKMYKSKNNRGLLSQQEQCIKINPVDLLVMLLHFFILQKNLGAYGDGGMIVTNNNFYQKLKTVKKIWDDKTYIILRNME